MNFLESIKMGDIRDYLILIRFPNLFTLPSNVVVGFSQLLILNDAKWETLLILITTSILLYTVGIILNDYFDRKIDRKERPNRPLPSGRISVRGALTFVFVATLISVLLAAYVSIFTLLITLMILGTILAYDCWLKNSIFGYLTIALSRVFNIVLGFSPLLFTTVSNYNDLMRIVAILASMFIYVTAISYLSRFEVGSLMKKTNYTFAIVLISIVPILSVLFTFMGFFKLDLFLSLPLFIGMLIITFARRYGRFDANGTRHVVKNLVLSIIILDSVFMSGSVGFIFGMSLLVFLIPASILSRKFYVT